MVVGYLNIEGIPLMPPKTYPPLIINTYAVLPLPITCVLLRAVAGWHPQIIEALSTIQNQQFSQSTSSYFQREPR